MKCGVKKGGGGGERDEWVKEDKRKKSWGKTGGRRQCYKISEQRNQR